MTSNEDMVFDPSCGISEEEQREIFKHINGIAEKNRLSLSGAADGSTGSAAKKGKKRRSRPGFKAKKSGGLFPTVVNISAIAILVGGLYALYTFQGKTNVQVREGVKVYNSAERALIEEIRKETSSRLEAKENEISLIASKLAEIDAELQGFQASSEDEERLRAMQDEYRASLANLQDERSRILEESRMREANLQAQLENRTRELALVSEQSAAAIDTAFGEMDRLSREQAQAAAVEAQMGALFANLNNAINGNRLEEAAEIVKLMRGFLNTPAFQGLRSIQARKDLYAQAINSFETMIEEARRYHAAMDSGVISLDKDAEQLLADLQEQNARLEQNITEKDKTLEAFSSQGDGMTRRLADLEGSVSALRTVNTALEASSGEKDNQIRSMEQERTTLRNTINSQESTISNQESTISRQESTISNRDGCITQIQEIIQGRAIANMTIGELSDSLTKIQEALQTLQ